VYIILCILFISILVPYGVLSSRKAAFSNQLWYDPVMNALLCSTIALPTALFTKWLSDIGKN
jgi:hypothetical protein